MAEGVRIETDLGELAERVQKIITPHLDLMADADLLREIAVRLRPPAADDFPTPSRDMFANPLEQARIKPFDLMIDPRFALREADVRIRVQPFAGGTACRKRFVYARMPRPKPDRIQMRIENHMNSQHDYFLIFYRLLSISH